MGNVRSKITSEVRRARHQRAIRGKAPLVFLHVGKTGGTAVKAALKPHVDDASFAIDLRRHETTMMDLPPGTAFFFAVRDPVERFVSGFGSRQRHGAPRLNVPWTPDEDAAFSRFTTANELAEAIGTPEADDAMRSIDHVRWSYWRWFRDEDAFLAREPDIFCILRQYDLARDFERLTARLGLTGKATLPTDDVKAHRNPPHLDRHLSELAIANLTKWYARDYDFLRLCDDVHARLAS